MNGQSLRVWLVDDDASIRWVLERALRNGGIIEFESEAGRTVFTLVLPLGEDT